MLISGWSADGFRRVRRIVERVGGRAAAIPSGRPEGPERGSLTAREAGDAASGAGPGVLAVVGLRTGDRADVVALGVIQSLVAAGVVVIAHADGASAWTLSAKCEPLLAGATQLLDATAAGFPEELGTLVSRYLAAERKRRAELDEALAAARRLGLVGSSPAFVRVLQTVVRIAPLSDLPVLLQGETGTGKELLAGAVHRLDPKRCAGPFVAVNCASIARGVAESELFGHRRGAFTGADRSRKGLFRSASGGVLFLDEIGELNLELQAKLLRVLQDGRVLGVGEDREEAVDVRVIAATNRDLAARVRAGAFREDLFFRLSALVVLVPPLRERPEDIAPLASWLWTKHAPSDAPPPVFAPEFLEALRRLHLPGNVRQVENLVRQVMLRKDDDRPVGLAHLPDELLRSLRSPGGTDPLAPPDPAGLPRLERPVELDGSGAGTEVADMRPVIRVPPIAPGGADPRAGSAARHYDAVEPLLAVFEGGGWQLERCMDACERMLIDAALRRARGNQSEAARLLGVSPRTIYNKLRKHGLQV